MHLILLPIAIQGCSSLRKFSVLVSQELLLVVNAVGDVAVVVTLVLHSLVQVVLVVGLGQILIAIGLERRVLLESALAKFHILQDFPGLKNVEGSLGDVELVCRFSHPVVVGFGAPFIGVTDCVRAGLEGKAALHG